MVLLIFIIQYLRERFSKIEKTLIPRHLCQGREFELIPAVPPKLAKIAFAHFRIFNEYDPLRITFHSSSRLKGEFAIPFDCLAPTDSSLIFPGNSYWSFFSNAFFLLVVLYELDSHLSSIIYGIFFILLKFLLVFCL